MGRLTGLEKCERNVLPVLNNLLEVSPHLLYTDHEWYQDIFLTLYSEQGDVSRRRQDAHQRRSLRQAQENAFQVLPLVPVAREPKKQTTNARIVHTREDFRRLGLVKVHPNFRVIALGLPVLYLVQWP